MTVAAITAGGMWGASAASAVTVYDSFSGSCSGSSTNLPYNVTVSWVTPPTFGLYVDDLTCRGTINGIYGTWHGTVLLSVGVAGGTCLYPEFVASPDGYLFLHATDGSSTDASIQLEAVFAPRRNTSSRSYSAQLVGLAGGLASFAFTWAPYNGCADGYGTIPSASLLTAVPLQG